MNILFEVTIALYIFICFGFWDILFTWCLNIKESINTYFWLLLNRPTVFWSHLRWWWWSGGLFHLLLRLRLIIFGLNVLLNIFVGLGPIFILGPDNLSPEGSTDIVIQNIIQIREDYGVRNTEMDNYPLTISLGTPYGYAVAPGRESLFYDKPTISPQLVELCVHRCSGPSVNGISIVDFSSIDLGYHNFPSRLLNGHFNSWQLTDQTRMLMKNCFIQDVNIGMSKVRLACPIVEENSFIILLPGMPRPLDMPELLGNYNLTSEQQHLYFNDSVILEQYIYLENIGFFPLKNSILHGFIKQQFTWLDWCYHSGSYKALDGSHQLLSLDQYPTIEIGPGVLQAHNEASLRTAILDFLRQNQ